MSRAFVVAGARVRHETATVADLEAATHAEPAERLRELAARDGVSEAFLLQTCNRVEEYVVAPTPDAAVAALADAVAGVDPALVERTDHEASLRHLLRVAAGLESQVLGEDEVLGQLRRAYGTAQEAGAVGPVLEAALLKAIHVGERARTETAINDGTVSLGSAAVQLAERERGLDGRVALLVGAGRMAGVVACGLADAGVAELRVVNRSPDRARALVEGLTVPTTTAGLDALGEHLAAADVAVTTTASPDPVVTAADLEDAGPTLLIDLAQPRDVAPTADEREWIDRRDLDALRAVTDATHEERREAAAEVEAIVDEEYALLIDQLKRHRADDVIRGMYRGAEGIKRREVERAVARLEADGLTDDQRETVEALADALVSQLLAVPTRSLREAAAEDDWETIASAIQLFDPSRLGGAVPADWPEVDGTLAARAAESDD